MANSPMITLNKDGRLEYEPVTLTLERTRLVMREDRIELAQIITDTVEAWIPNKHPRWPKNTMRGTENIGGQFMEVFNTETLLKEIGDVPDSGPSDPSKWLDISNVAAGSKHIKQVQIFRAMGQGGDKIVVRMRLDTPIPKAPKEPVVHKGDSVKIADLPVGTKFKDANGYGWEIVSGAGESYVTVLPVASKEFANPGDAENPWPHGKTRVIGKGDAFLDTPVKAQESEKEVDDGTPEKQFSNISAFVTKTENFTLDKLYNLLQNVDAKTSVEESSHGFKNSPYEGNYHAFVAASKGEKAVSSSASMGKDAVVFARATTSNKPDETPHDPSIAQHAEGGLTAAQWKNFGAKDQASYNRLVEKFGAWTSGKGSSLVQQAKDESDHETMQLYNKSISAQSGSSHHATDGGHMFPIHEGYNVYASNNPGVTKEQYLKFEKLMYKIQDVAMYDLYSRVKDPSLILIHNNDFPVSMMEANMANQQHVPGQYPFFGGVSWSTNMAGLSSFGKGGSIILMRIPVERISLYNLIQGLYSTNEAEFTIRQEMFFDPDNTLFAHRESQWEGGPETWQKLIDTLHTTGSPKPGSHWKDVLGWHKGYVDPPMPLGDMEDGQFFRDDNDVVWYINNIDDKVHATSYLDLGNKVAFPKSKTYEKTTEFAPVTPKIEASKLAIGEVIIDENGNTWQNVGIEDSSNMHLAPYEVSDGNDPHSLVIPKTMNLKLSSLGEPIPDWVATYKKHSPSLVSTQLEGAIVMTPWGQRVQVLTPSKHGQGIKVIQVDEHDNQIANTETTMNVKDIVSELKKGHPPLPPPAIGDQVEMSQMKAGDVISRKGIELKILSGAGGTGNIKVIYNENTPDHLKGELALGDDYTPNTKFKYERKESLPVWPMENYPNESDSVWIDDLDVGDTFYYKKKYWRIDKMPGTEGELHTNVSVSEPNPSGVPSPIGLETSTKVWPSGIPAKPFNAYISPDQKTVIDFDSIKDGDLLEIGAQHYQVKISGVSGGYGSYFRDTNGNRIFKSAMEDTTIYRYELSPRPKPGESVIARSLWIGDVVETADGQKLKVAKSPAIHDQPFTDLATGEPELHDAQAYYTYLGSADDLVPGKAPQKQAPLPSGVNGYDTSLADTKAGYIVQTTNGSRWRVFAVDTNQVRLIGVDGNNEPLSGVEANVLIGTGDLVGVIDTGRKTLGALVPGDLVGLEDAYGNETYAVISQSHDDETVLHPQTNSMGEPYIVNKPELKKLDKDLEVKYLGKSTPHVEMAPLETEAKSGYAKKSPQIGEVELWPPGSAVVTSGNYFYIVGASSHGETTITDMAGKQHQVPSKTFLVKGASNGPKPQKGLKLVASNDIIYRPPHKGEYVYLMGERYVVIKPQIKSASVAPVDEYGNITGEIKKLTALGSNNENQISRVGIALLHPQKDNEPLPKISHDTYEPTIVKHTDRAGVSLGDYVQLDEGNDKYMAIAKPKDGSLHLAHVDKNGNVTGVITVKEDATNDQFGILTRPDGRSKAKDFVVGQSIATDDGVVVVVETGVSTTRVAKLDNSGETVNLMNNLLVKAPDKPAEIKTGDIVSSWALNDGDIVKIPAGSGNSLSNYSNEEQIAEVLTNQSTHLALQQYPYEEGVSKKWTVQNRYYAGPVTIVHRADDPAPVVVPPPTPKPEATQAGTSSGTIVTKNDLKEGDTFEIISPSPGKGWQWRVEGKGLVAVNKDVASKQPNVIHIWDKKHMDDQVKLISSMGPTTAHEMAKKDTTIGDMEVGEFFQVNQADGNGVFTWKVADKNEDTMHLLKVGTNPDQSANLKTTFAHYKIPATKVPAAAWENQPVTQKSATIETPNQNSVAGIWHHLKIGSVFTHVPPDAHPDDKIQTWEVVSGPQVNQNGIVLNIQKVGTNDGQLNNFVLRPNSFEGGIVKMVTSAEPIEKPGPTAVVAKAFTEAVAAEQATGTPRLEAVAKTAIVMHKTLDEAIDSFPAANEPQSGMYIPMNELKMGDTYKIMEGEKYKGWVWHIDGGEGGNWNLTAVDKKDDQPETLVSHPFNGTKLVEKIAADNPVATLDATALVPGDVFQIKVGTGEVFTWKVISIENGIVHLQAVGSTKGTPQQKNFKTALTNIVNQIGSGNWLPV